MSLRIVLRFVMGNGVDAYERVIEREVPPPTGTKIMLGDGWSVVIREYVDELDVGGAALTALVRSDYSIVAIVGVAPGAAGKWKKRVEPLPTHNPLTGVRA